MELKPCPFCGKPVSIYYSSATEGYYAVHKDEQNSDCLLLMPIEINHNRIFYDLADAYAAWNRRGNYEDIYKRTI